MITPRVRKLALLSVVPALLASFAFNGAALARPASDDGARVISVSTRPGGTVHQRLVLSQDKAAVIQLDTDARDVLVSNPELVDAVVRTPRRIFLLANKVGQTNAFFFDAAGKQILALDIRVEKDTVDLASLMKMALPNSAIAVQAMNDNIVLTGQVASALESTRAGDLAAKFAGDPKKVVNMLSVASGQQVMLKVRMAEMDRNVAKQFGLNLTAGASVAGVPMVASTSNPYGLMGTALSNLSGAQIGSACGASQFLPNVTSSVVNGVTNALTGAAAAGVSHTATTGFQTDLVVDPATGNNILHSGPPEYFETAQQATDSLNNTATSSLNTTATNGNNFSKNLTSNSSVSSAYRFSASLALGALIAIAIWTIAPAFGAMTLYVLPPELHPLVSMTGETGRAQIALLRNGPGLIVPDALHGSLIGFPSYHCVLALLVSWHGWELKRLRWPLILLNAIVVISTPVQGGHHLVDVLGAVPVTALALWIARKRTSAESSQKTRGLVNEMPNSVSMPAYQGFFRIDTAQNENRDAVAIKSTLSGIP